MLAIDALKKSYRFFKIIIKYIINLFYLILNIKNKFMFDLFCFTIAIHRIDVFELVRKSYKEKLNSINKFLYIKLSVDDKKVFIRWLLKRYYGVNTAYSEEIRVIDDAFDKVAEIYPQEQPEGDDVYPIKLDFLFKGKNILFNTLDHQKHKYSNLGPDEKRLMRFYTIAHAFYLTEYVMDGFNPKNGQVIFDCGAARGDTLLLFKSLYPDSPIHSFEYDKQNADMVKLNIQDNGLHDAFITNTFLYSETGKANIDKNSYNIVPEMTENTLVIDTLALDDYVSENCIENIGLIKFDIEGGEQEALKGSVNTIKTQKPLLYIPLYHLDSDIHAIPEFLHSLNMPMEFRLKWTEKKVWGVDCVLFVRFI